MFVITRWRMFKIHIFVNTTKRWNVNRKRSILNRRILYFGYYTFVFDVLCMFYPFKSFPQILYIDIHSIFIIIINSYIFN